MSPTIMRSGSKIVVIGGGGMLLAAIAAIVHRCIMVDPNIGAHISFSQKFWPLVHKLILGW